MWNSVSSTGCSLKAAAVPVHSTVNLKTHSSIPCGKIAAVISTQS